MTGTTRGARARARRGRRPGNPDTRGDILAAANRLFATAGYDGTSMRAVARRAGVDAALVHHYFHDKVELLLAVLQIELDPRAKIQRLLEGDPATLGGRLVAMVLGVWESPLGSAALQAHQDRPELIRVVTGVISRGISDLVAAQCGEPVASGPATPPVLAEDVTRRIALVETIVGGMIMTRFIAQIQPAAGLPSGEVVQLLGPLVQRACDMPAPRI